MRSVPGINLRERFQLTNFNTCYVRLDVNDFSVFLKTFYNVSTE